MVCGYHCNDDETRRRDWPSIEGYNRYTMRKRNKIKKWSMLLYTSSYFNITIRSLYYFWRRGGIIAFYIILLARKKWKVIEKESTNTNSRIRSNRGCKLTVLLHNDGIVGGRARRHPEVGSVTQFRFVGEGRPDSISPAVADNRRLMDY